MLPYPPRELWPKKTYSLPDLSYPDTLNACHELLDRTLERGHGSFPAIHFGKSVITYAELHEQVMRFAGAFRGQGIGPGDRVILRLLNRPHFISAFLALLRIGSVVAPTPPLIRACESGAVTSVSGPGVCV